MSQRNNVVEQIGLRGSHFTLGNNNPNPFVTVSHTSFNNQPVEKQMPNIKQESIENAVAHDKANLRASHFQLGTSDPKSFYYTTNSVNLKHHKDYDKAVLSEEQKKDLRTHHFRMGQYAPTTQTINNITYDKKPIIEMKDQEKLKQFMRGHHHDFREMNNTIMTTKYNDDYNNEIDKNALFQGNTQEQMREKALALRHSHIVLGKEVPQFSSVQQQDYTKKSNVYKPQSKDLQGSHFELGVQKDEMCTTNDIFHNQQPIVKNPLAQETMNELRQSHFTMGQDALSYKSEMAGNFQKKNETRQKQLISTAALQQNHFSLGDENKNLNYQTAYSSTMTRPLQQDQQGQTRDQLVDRGSNFQIGHQGNSYTSEFSASFQKQYGAPSELNEAKKRDLRSSHFGFTDIPQNTYQTSYKQSYVSNNIKEGRGVLEENLQKDLRANHFHLGNQNNNYSTTQRTFHKHPGNPNPVLLNAEKKADLRAHHFKLG